ncbi:MAG TPA: hypothetical protein VKM55_00570 [Candidatus Lokiarchaeia archaeon]|nr:hypothetical protein [Candidatus Lokiarchaeia archaeon]
MTYKVCLLSKLNSPIAMNEGRMNEGKRATTMNEGKRAIRRAKGGVDWNIIKDTVDAG